MMSQEPTVGTKKILANLFFIFFAETTARQQRHGYEANKKNKVCRVVVLVQFANFRQYNTNDKIERSPQHI
jgi:hypothetical protein